MSPAATPRWLASRSFLEVLALTGFAVAQPVLSVFGRSPDYFIFHDASPGQIVAFAVVVTVVPAVLLGMSELVVSLVSPRAGRLMHVGLLAALVGLIAVQALKKATPLGSASLVVASVAIAALAAALYLRIRVARLYLLFASPAPVVFALLFVLTSPVSKLVFEPAVHAVRLGSSRAAPSVVMITFDEWPTASIVNANGEIDAGLFPHLAALAHGATWYRNATSVTSSTWYAVPTILTGKYPKDGQLPEVSSHPENLFTFLGRTHRLSVAETVTRLCPSSLCTRPLAGSASSGMQTLLKDAAKTYRSMVSPRTSHTDVTAGFEDRETKAAAAQARASQDHANIDLGAATANRLERFNQFLDSIHRGEKPTLHFLHILLPHVAYRFLPSGAQYPYPDTDFGKQDDNWTDQTWPPALAHERMLLQTGYVDRLVGELVDRLRQRGLYDRSVVVITADHGIAFDPGGPARGLTDRPVPAGLYPQILWSPLIVKASSQTAGKVSDANVMSVDVLPTIADLVGFKLPWKVDGISAVGSAPRATDEKIFLKATVNGFGVGLGPPIRYDGRSGERAMLAGNVDAITEPGDVPTRIWRVKPEGFLAARKVSELSVRDDAGLDAELHSPDAFTHVDPASGTVPALVWGKVSRGLDEGRSVTIAVAVNGVIGGMSPTFRDGNTQFRFAAMVPDALFRPGRNDVQLYTVTGSVGAITLHPVTLVKGGG